MLAFFGFLIFVIVLAATALGCYCWGYCVGKKDGYQECTVDTARKTFSLP